MKQIAFAGDNPAVMPGESAGDLNRIRFSRLILLCSKHKRVHKLVCKALDGSDFTLHTARTKKEAYLLLGRNDYILLISDLLDSSWRLYDNLRSRNRQLPLIMLMPKFTDLSREWKEKALFDYMTFCAPIDIDAELLSKKVYQFAAHYRGKLINRIMHNDMQRDLQLAARMQRAFLPPCMARKDDYEYSMISLPYRNISGDLFHIMPINDRKRLIILGDVSGHGISSSIAMTAIQIFLLKQSYGDDVKLSHVASDLNSFIVNYLDRRIYMCSMILLFDVARETLSYYVSGYNELFRYDYELERFTVVDVQRKGTLPLGMFPNMIFTEDDVVETGWKEDDLYLTFSDGLSDLSKSEQGNSPVPEREILSVSAGLIRENRESIFPFPYRLMESLRHNGYTHQMDDISIHVFRRCREERDIIRYQLPATYAGVEAAGKQLGHDLEKRHWCDDDIVRAELLFEEFCCNVIRHSKAVTAQDIFSTVKFSDGGLRMTLYLRGDGFDLEKSLEEIEPEGILARKNRELAASGRGLPIIKKCTSAVTAADYGGLNVVTFTIVCKKGKMEG